MITTIRKHLGFGLAQRIFIIMMVLALMGVFSLPMLFKKNNVPWIIKVNEDTISHKQLQQQTEQQRERIAFIRSQYGEFADLIFRAYGISLDPESLARDFLINQSLLGQFAEKLHLTMSKEYISEKLLDRDFCHQYLSDIVPQFIFTDAHSINEKALQSYLQRQGYSFDTFLALVEQGLKRQLCVELISQFLYIPNFEVKTLYQAETSAKKFQILKIPFEFFLKKARIEEVSKDDLIKYFNEENKKTQRYFYPEKRKARVWKISSEKYGIEISKDEIEKYYQTNKNKHYIATPAMVQVRIISYNKDVKKDRPTLAEVRNELLQDPDLFASYAEKYSDDPSSKHGGLLEYFTREDKKYPEIEKKAFLLPKNGNISDIINLQNGQAIIQLVEKKSRTYKSIEEVRSEIQKKLRREKFKESVIQDIKPLLSQGVLDKEKLETLVVKKSGKKESVTVSLTDNNELSKELFKIRRPNKASFFFDEQGVSVVLLTEIIKSHPEDLKAIESRVKEDFYTQEAEKKQKETLGNLYEKKDFSMDALAKEFHISLENSSWMKPSDYKERKDLPGEKMVQLETEGSILVTEKGKDGFIIKLVKIAPIDEIEWDKNKKDQKTQKESEYKRFLVEGLIASFYRDATIETNTSTEIEKEDYTL